jgi:hypothetical protein
VHENPIQSARSEKSYLLTAALALAGTALKIYQWYFSKPLWVDEEMLLLNVRDRAMSELIGPLWLNQAAPLGWVALQRAVITEFGTSDRAVRAIPVLFGIGTLWVAWWMAKRWMNPLAAATFLVLCGTAQWMTYYALEAKPYSADGFWALALPTLAIWAAEPVSQRPLSLARIGVWWSVAAIAQWFSFGAIFVTPGCAVALCAVGWWRAGWRLAAAIALQGIVWLIFFGAHYAISLGYASNDEYLWNYWRSAFPPANAGLTGTVSWLAKQFEPIASNPAGTTLWLSLWLCVAYGIAVSLSRQPAIGLVILCVTISPFALAALRRLPLADRLAFWMVPALYAAVAFAIDDGITRGRMSFSRRKWSGVAVAVGVLVIAGTLCLNIVERGRDNFFVGGDNHGLDDRRALRELMFQRQSGDVWLTTHLGLPAIWWYGNTPISGPNGGSIHAQDKAPIFELNHIPRGTPGCRESQSHDQLSKALAGSRRAAVHLGFGTGIPPGLQELILDELSRLGSLASYRRISSEGVAVTFDFTQPPRSWRLDVARPSGPRLEDVKPAAGCIGVQRATRW